MVEADVVEMAEVDATDGRRMWWRWLRWTRRMAEVAAAMVEADVAEMEEVAARMVEVEVEEMAAEEVGTTDVAEMEARWPRQVWPEMEEVEEVAGGGGGSANGGRASEFAAAVSLEGVVAAVGLEKETCLNQWS
jgi:hypothetical protein